MKHSLLNSAVTETPDEPAFAPLPYVRPRMTLMMHLHQYRILVLTQLAEYRSDWFFHAFAGLLLPVALVFFARSIIGQVNIEGRIYLLGGNLAMSISFGPPLFMMGKLGGMRQSRAFDYWLAMPIPTMTLMLSIVSIGLLFALPGLLGSYLLGTLLLGLPWSGGWLLLVLVPLGALSLTGFGIFIGSIVPNAQTAGIVGNIMITVIGFLSPMLIPLQNLPGPLQILARFIPTTYIADAFRIALGGHSIASLPFDVAVLIAVSIVLLGIANWKIDWRAS